MIKRIFGDTNSASMYRGFIFALGVGIGNLVANLVFGYIFLGLAIVLFSYGLFLFNKEESLRSE